MNYSTVYVSVMQDRVSVVFDLDGLSSRLANLPDHRLRQPVTADRIGRAGGGQFGEGPPLLRCTSRTSPAFGAYTSNLGLVRTVIFIPASIDTTSYGAV
jgi:hypothetical protein